MILNLFPLQPLPPPLPNTPLSSYLSTKEIALEIAHKSPKILSYHEGMFQNNFYSSVLDEYALFFKTYLKYVTLDGHRGFPKLYDLRATPDKMFIGFPFSYVWAQI